MKKTAKILALSLVGVSVFSLASCGDLKDKYGNEGETTRTIELIINENATTTVTFAYLAAGFGEDPYYAVANAYMEKHPDVQIQPYSNAEIDAALNLYMVPGSSEGLADIYSYRWETTLKTWIGQGLVEPLDDLMTKDTGDGRTMGESISAAAAAAITVDESIYAVPEYTNVTGFVYNMDLFEQYGWQIPTTTKQLADLCDQILRDTNGAVTPITWCQDADGYLYHAAENWISQREGLANMQKFYEMQSVEVYANEDNDVGSLYTSKKSALDNIVKFFAPETDWCYDDSSTIYFKDAQRNVIKGECAMMLNGSWFENEMYKELNENNGTYKDVKIGMFPIPELSDNNGIVSHADGYTTVDNKRVLTSSFGAYYFIPANAPNKEAAKDFLLFLNSEEGCETYTKHSNAIRPFTYDYGMGTEVYEEVSVFGKSVLKMAAENHLYSPIYTSPLIKAGKGKLWVRDNALFISLVSDANSRETVSAVMRNEYTVASSKWSDWWREATE